jgi:hypothetical protein
MPVTYINRKGKTYCLHQGTTTKGNPKYFFAIRDEGDLVATIPPGYEIHENPNAQVFLRRKRAQIITDGEVETVKASVQQHSDLEYFILDVKGNGIIVYSPDQDIDLLMDTFDLQPGARSVKKKAVLENALTFSPMLQFVLMDEEERLFEPQRYSYLGSIEDWINIGDIDLLPELVETYMPHLDEDSFYDLY